MIFLNIVTHVSGVQVKTMKHLRFEFTLVFEPVNRVEGIELP
ncbi:MAG TPA: hypothetical protein VFD91_02885 [Mariniphaga sp.]|nr:hypothetical protein [Mariniphaga sp.]